MNGDGHDELKQLIQLAHDHDQQGGSGQFEDGPAEREHASEFRAVVVSALRNLAGRVQQLERDLQAAEETIQRLEGR